MCFHIFLQIIIVAHLLFMHLIQLNKPKETTITQNISFGTCIILSSMRINAHFAHSMISKKSLENMTSIRYPQSYHANDQYFELNTHTIKEEEQEENLYNVEFVYNFRMMVLMWFAKFREKKIGGE